MIEISAAFNMTKLDPSAASSMTKLDPSAVSIMTKPDPTASDLVDISLVEASSTAAFNRSKPDPPAASSRPSSIAAPPAAGPRAHNGQSSVAHDERSSVAHIGRSTLVVERITGRHKRPEADMQEPARSERILAHPLKVSVHPLALFQPRAA